MNDDLDVMIQSADPFADAAASGVGPSETLWRTINERRGHGRAVGAHTRAIAVSGIVVVLGISLALVAGALPGSGPLSDSAAAAQLRAIAANAGSPQTVPGGGLWLHRTLAFSLQSSPPVGATLTGTVDTWVSGTQACQAAVFQPAQFGSAAAASAWRSAGLSTSPVAPGAQGYCGATARPGWHGMDSRSGLSDGITPIDVSGLTSDPATLAHELETGTTGIPSLDHMGSQSTPQAAFDRAVLLLVAPLTGAQPGVLSSLYDALALLPHVSGLGTVTTHAGTRGEGFSASTTRGAVTIVVNSHTGQLLEVRNLQFVAWRALWASMVVVSFTASGSTSGILDSPLSEQLYFSHNWIDPVGPPTVVGGNSIPHLRTQVYN
ncbi:MAG: hypothetical protein ACYCVN_07010 [Acidimicrobiales bacterium]